MEIKILPNGKRKFYYQDKDIVIQLSTKQQFQVKEVKDGKIYTYSNEVIPLTLDIQATQETLDNALVKVIERKVKAEDVVYFAKLKDDVIIPSKDEENGGYDIYANFEEDYITIPAHKTVMIPTKILSAFSSKYVMILKERGSTGTKGMGQRCGVIDSGYRGEWLVPITNENDGDILIVKKNVVPITKIGTILYPYEKAICQAILVEVPKVKIQELTADELKAIPSKRGDGKLGSSGK